MKTIDVAALQGFRHINQSTAVTAAKVGSKGVVVPMPAVLAAKVGGENRQSSYRQFNRLCWLDTLFMRVLLLLSSSHVGRAGASEP